MHYHHFGLPWILLPWGAFPLYWNAPYLGILEPDELGQAPFIYHGEDRESVSGRKYDHALQREPDGAYVRLAT